jgi:hypothetical protein
VQANESRQAPAFRLHEQVGDTRRRSGCESLALAISLAARSDDGKSRVFVDGASPGLPRNAVTGRSYSGVNVLILWGEVIAKVYANQGWLTFRQALAAQPGIELDSDQLSRCHVRTCGFPAMCTTKIGSGNLGSE